MTKRESPKTSLRRINPFILTMFIVFMAFCGFFLYTFIFAYLETPFLAKNTSTNYRYKNSFSQTLERYSDLGQMYLDDLSFAIPGLSTTNVMGKTSMQMVPQGMCKAGDYILISAYNASASMNIFRYRQPILNSVIYILSQTGEYLNTMVLPDVNHVGGLTFDGSHVWVAKCQDRTCSVIPFEDIERAAGASEVSIPLTSYLADKNCNRESSFVEYYDGKLWIGTFAEQDNASSEVGIYEIGDLDDCYNLKEIASLELPAKAQGISFYEEDGTNYMIVSTSYGRKNDSYYYLYELNQTLDDYALAYLGKCMMPRMSEEMFNDGQYAYLLFESAATRYSKNVCFHCNDPIDRICVVETKNLMLYMK